MGDGRSKSYVRGKYEGLDDFGVKELELVYAVNGAKERRSSCLAAGKAAHRGVGRAHDLVSEELRLVPGDSVPYYAEATDTDSVPSGRTVSSDIYFVQIPPRLQGFTPSRRRPAGAAAAVGGNDVGQPSQQQKEMTVAATFNVVRDKAEGPRGELSRERGVPSPLSQGKLKTQIEELIEKMRSRQVDSGRAVR